MNTLLSDIRSTLPPSTQILAVSKLQPAKKIQQLFSEGQIAFAENYLQEALTKQQELAHLPIQWHFIGRLQSKKLKALVGKFQLIHSVDKLEQATKIDEIAQAKNLVQKILLQINLAGEASKGGLSRQELLENWDKFQNLKSAKVIGLMTMPPLAMDPELVRPIFRELRELRDQLHQSTPWLRELSMGTTQDYLVAAQEGATIVRLGTLLFGERPGKDG